MKLSGFSFLADENIHEEVVAHLRSIGLDVKTAFDAHLIAADDSDLLEYCVRDRRVVLTHDSDFGQLAIAGGNSVVGIVYLRPGHILPSFTIQTLQVLFRQSLDVKPPFLVVAVRRDREVNIRLRQW